MFRKSTVGPALAALSLLLLPISACAPLAVNSANAVAQINLLAGAYVADDIPQITAMIFSGSWIPDTYYDSDFAAGCNRITGLLTPDGFELQSSTDMLCDEMPFETHLLQNLHSGDFAVLTANSFRIGSLVFNLQTERTPEDLFGEPATWRIPSVTMPAPDGWYMESQTDDINVIGFTVLVRRFSCAEIGAIEPPAIVEEPNRVIVTFAVNHQMASTLGQRQAVSLAEPCDEVPFTFLLNAPPGNRELIDGACLAAGADMVPGCQTAVRWDPARGIIDLPR